MHDQRVLTDIQSSYEKASGKCSRTRVVFWCALIRIELRKMPSLFLSSTEKYLGLKIEMETSLEMVARGVSLATRAFRAINWLGS